MKIKSGDTVKVISGADRGHIGKVVSVDHEKNKITIEGVNMVHKHVKPSQRNPQGGRLHKEMPIDVSNVMAICPRTNAQTKIGMRYLKDGSKERFARVSGESMGMVSPPKKAHANE